MPIFNVKFPAKKLVVFFVVDTSFSMEGAKIEALNQAAEEAILLIRQNSKNNDDITIEIAVLQFSTGIKWSYPNPLPAESFAWQTLTADGATDFGAACSELSLKLTAKAGGFMYSESGSFAPVFILLSKGYSTDIYQTPLKNLKENIWFKAGIKIAIAIGDDANLDVLSKFTGSLKSVYTVINVDSLKGIIRSSLKKTSTLIEAPCATLNYLKRKQVEKQILKCLDEDIQNGTITTVTGGNTVPDDWE